AHAPGGGRLALGATMDGKRQQLALDLRLEALHTDSYLPPEARALAGGTLTGHLHADADLAHLQGSLHGIDFTLAGAHGGGLPTAVRVHGDAVASATRVKTPGITVEIEGASATARGEVALAKKTMDLALDVAAPDLAGVLRTIGAPPVAKSAHVVA